MGHVQVSALIRDEIVEETLAAGRGNAVGAR
jgi:hypothetical protein